MGFPYSRLHKCGTPMLHRSCQPRWPLHLRHPCQDLHRRNHRLPQDRPWFESSRAFTARKGWRLCWTTVKTAICESTFATMSNRSSTFALGQKIQAKVGNIQYYGLLLAAITECSASLCPNQGNSQKTKARCGWIVHKFSVRSPWECRGARSVQSCTVPKQSPSNSQWKIKQSHPVKFLAGKMWFDRLSRWHHVYQRLFKLLVTAKAGI